MNSTRAFRLIAEFLGFLLVSAGGTLVATAVLLVLSWPGPGDGYLASTAWRLGAVAGCGLSGIAMLAAGVRLVRRST